MRGVKKPRGGGGFGKVAAAASKMKETDMAAGLSSRTPLAKPARMSPGGNAGAPTAPASGGSGMSPTGDAGGSSAAPAPSAPGGPGSFSGVAKPSTEY